MITPGERWIIRWRRGAYKILFFTIRVLKKKKLWIHYARLFLLRPVIIPRLLWTCLRISYPRSYHAIIGTKVKNKKLYNIPIHSWNTRNSFKDLKTLWIMKGLYITLCSSQITKVRVQCLFFAFDIYQQFDGSIKAVPVLMTCFLTEFSWRKCFWFNWDYFLKFQKRGEMQISLILTIYAGRYDIHYFHHLSNLKF
jgi:hypothetical protein